MQCAALMLATVYTCIAHLRTPTCFKQQRTHDFRMGGVEVPQAPTGWSVGRGIPLPTDREVWGGGRGPSQNFFSVFCIENTIF